MNNNDIILSILSYSLCSGSLVLINKLILHYIPYPSLVITIQLFSTLFFIYTASYFQKLEIDPIRIEHIKPYLIYTIGFSLGVYCNMKSLSNANIETVIVFRALAPVCVSVLDALFLGREWPSGRSWFALSLIAFGAWGYARTDEEFVSFGVKVYGWPIAYLLVISFEMAYGKRIVKSVDLKTRSGPVQYTNLLGWPPMLVFAHMGGEFGRLMERVEERGGGTLLSLKVFPLEGLVFLGVGCVVGTGIGYSSWWCRSNVSATSFTIVGVMNKCLTVIVNLLIWDNHAVPAGIASLFVCLIGGAIYRQAPMREKKEDPTLASVDDEECNSKGDEAKDDEMLKTPLVRKQVSGNEPKK